MTNCAHYARASPCCARCTTVFFFLIRTAPTINKPALQTPFTGSISSPHEWGDSGRFLVRTLEECTTPRQDWGPSKAALPNSISSDEVFVNSCCHRCNGWAPYELEAWQGDDDDDHEPSGDIVMQVLHAHNKHASGIEVRERFSVVSFGLNTC